MESRSRVMFIDTTHPLLRESLESAGFLCEDHTQNSRENILQQVSSFSGIIIRSRIQIDKEFLDAASRLEFIARAGAGMESIDIDEAGARGILCFNSPEGNRDALAEHTIGMILSLFNKLKKADAEVRKGVWLREENRGIELMGRTVGIIGYGNMGGAFVQRLLSFGVRILVYDKYKIDYGTSMIEETDMEEIFREADVLSLHVPLTDETRFLVKESFLSKFRKPIYLINTSRGPVVKTDDLVSALESGKVMGAALDVLEYEKFSFEKMDFSDFPEAFRYIAQSDNVILSPHIAGWTHESNMKHAQVLAGKILTYYQAK